MGIYTILDVKLDTSHIKWLTIFNSLSKPFKSDVFENLDFPFFNFKRVMQCTYPGRTLGSTVSPKHVHFLCQLNIWDINIILNGIERLSVVLSRFWSHFDIRWVHVRSDLLPNNFWKHFIFFRAVDFRIADCGLWICLIHTL